MSEVYLDYAATCPLYPEALEAMRPYLQAGLDNLGLGANANSLHGAGRRAFQAMEGARREVAEALGGGRPDEIIFTSGASEANNLFIKGAAVPLARERGFKFGGAEKPRIIVGGLEHPSVYRAAKAMRARGFDIVMLPHDRQGRVKLADYERELTPQTVLVSIQAANSEIGALQDIGALSQRAHAVNALFHTDATQAYGRIPLDVKAMGIDAMSISGHKIGAPKGIGALFLKARTPLEAQIDGGNQEMGKRSGTQNVCAYAALARCVAYAGQALAGESERLVGLRVMLAKGLSGIPGVFLTLPYDDDRQGLLPQIVHVTVPGMESETLIMKLDALGYCVSGGSACSSSSLAPSKVLLGIGMNPDQALCSLRVSMGRYTTPEDIQAFIGALRQVAKNG